jgi:D-alanyl-D-alanine-carboxypeptidase/D-alanyl-D-alanine-endopeptidase
MSDNVKTHFCLRYCTLFVVAAIVLAVSERAQATSVLLPTDDEVRKVLAERIESEHESVGMVVGIITPEGRRIISYGHLNQDDPRTPDGNTVFEIGSNTKIFTALLLADMIQKGEVALGDPIAKYLPKRTKVPERNGREITLVDLATHTSGLPFWPTRTPMGDSAIVMMAEYSVEDLYNFLASYELQNDVGTKWAYSNLGFGLLGHLLSLRAGEDYETMVHDRISGPLGMTSTAIALSAEMKNNLATGHDSQLRPAIEWNMPVLEGCGSLRSSANDLLTFLGAFMGLVKTPLDSAMALMTETRRPGPQLAQALGWWITFEQGNDQVITHPGATLGYSSTIAYDPKMRVGVVALSNSVGGDVGSITWHILRPDVWPWSTKPTERKEISVDPKILAKYAGSYQAAPGVVIEIVCDSTGLVMKTPSTPPDGLRLHAQSERDFFVAEVDLQVSFQIGLKNHAEGIIVRFGGNDTLAPLIETRSDQE